MQTNHLSYTGLITAKTTNYSGVSDRYDYRYDLMGRLAGADFSSSVAAGMMQKGPSLTTWSFFTCS